MVLSVKRIFFTVALCLLGVNIRKVHTEDYVYGSEPDEPQNEIYGSEFMDQDNNCQNNELPGSIVPDLFGNLQVQALRRKLRRILSSPTMNENIVPNYEALSDGKLLFDLASQNGGHLRNWWHPNFKRNIGAILKSKSVPHNLKRSLATLAKNGQLPTSHQPEDELVVEDNKRNLAALAKARSIGQFSKKSLQSLARNSHFPDKTQNGGPETYYEYNLDELPLHPYYNDMGKRNIGSIAKAGNLQNPYRSLFENKRNIQYVMKSGGAGPVGGKRNIPSLLRNNNMPETTKEDLSNNNNKRNIGAMARDWALPNHSTGSNRNSEDKRNAAALLRQDAYAQTLDDDPTAEIYPIPGSGESVLYELKRNIGSIKAGKRDVKRSINDVSDRHKRQADEYFTENAEDYNPVLHKSNVNDYDELVRALTSDYFYYPKRFLGNIPLSRMTELGKISLMGQSSMSNATPTSPTYRRKQYLLSRTMPVEAEEK